ncbi:hypothetical protein BGZ73_006831 [Actinomortierella ambigua]|nr:hypothetical protein BGZ73_006831 [Actinomortierella ambigua]
MTRFLVHSYHIFFTPGPNNYSNNTEPHRAAYTPSEELIYSRIQAAKARQQKRQQQTLQQHQSQQPQPRGFRGPPPIPKQGANGKNSKHAFWPQPEQQQRGEAHGARRRGLINIQFSRATALTDPTVREDYAQEEFANGLEQEETSHAFDRDDSEEDDESSDDILHHEVDSEDSDEEFLMQQFNWIEEDQDPDRRKLVASAAASGDDSEPQETALLSSWGGVLQYQTQAESAEIEAQAQPNTSAFTADTVSTLKPRRQSPQTTSNTNTTTTSPSKITTSVPMLDARAVASELQNLSRPLSAMSQTSLKSFNHQDKKPKLGRNNNTAVNKTTFGKQGQQDGRCELSSRVETMEISMEEPGQDTISTQSTIASIVDDGRGTPELVATTTTTTTTTSSTSMTKDEVIVLTKDENPEPLMWVMDTNPTPVVETLPDTYITLPVEPETHEGDMFTKPKRKAHRSKRGGVKAREKLKGKQEQATHKNTGDDDGTIYLSDTGAQDDQDEEMLALQDYLENTMDPDNPDHYDSLVDALRGLHAGPGHSKDAYAEGADDSDFEVMLSEDDSQDEYMNDFYDDEDDDDDDDDDDDELDDFDFEQEDENGNIHFKSSLGSSASRHQKDRRQNRKIDQLLREELTDNLLPLWQAGAMGDEDVAFANRKGGGRFGNNSNRARRAKGYEAMYDPEDHDSSVLPAYMARKHAKGKKERHDGSLETLTEINNAIIEFVHDHTSDSLQLPPMPKALRRRVHLLCNHYNLRSQSTGSGKRRFPVLIKTERTRMPLNPVKVSRFLQQGDKELTYLSAQFQGSTNGKRNQRYGDKGKGGSSGPGARRGGGGGGGGGGRVHGAVVGSEAAELTSDNIGHRMLAKMGWTPGVGLGAAGEGITQPIEAVMRAKRRGLGH